ncbi:MAG: FkbM family methyltransferase [Flammeovirgaceae bacterium]|nr:MAG: FkbM family methyltransferase [Flammeovirgaceae bacterium]
MFWFLSKCIQKFGVAGGLSVYVQIKILRQPVIKLPGYRQPIHYRPGTADLTTFREIFLREEYNLDLPASIKPKTIIDVGANIGFTSLFFSRHHPDATIYSLEPEPGNFKLLQKNVEGYSNITAMQAALWNENGTIGIEDHGYGLRGFMVEKPSGKSQTMQALTLQSLIEQHNITSIDILKIDIEGSEKEVFSGDTGWLRITKCLVIELHDRMKPGCSEAVFGALSRHHFSKRVKGENLVFINQEIISSPGLQ